MSIYPYVLKMYLIQVWIVPNDLSFSSKLLNLLLLQIFHNQSYTDYLHKTSQKNSYSSYPVTSVPYSPYKCSKE